MTMLPSDILKSLPRSRIRSHRYNTDGSLAACDCLAAVTDQRVQLDVSRLVLSLLIAHLYDDEAAVVAGTPLGDWLDGMTDRIQLALVEHVENKALAILAAFTHPH